MKFFISSLFLRIFQPFIQQIVGVARSQINAHSTQIETQLMLQGRALSIQNLERAPIKNIQEAEFKVFSQYGEDGILQYLVKQTNISRDEQTFVEFGVQDYLESNTRFLLQSDHWRGLIIDGSAQYMESVRKSELYWRNDLTAVDAWIDRDNINKLIEEAGFAGNIGVLSIDIDGNDYWVWERIDVVNPVIVVTEWNSVFGPDHAVSVPYDPGFDRQSKHYSNLYWGASIRAFEHLAHKKGYALLGSNRVGNNIFFVRRDRMKNLNEVKSREAYVESRFRDSRDKHGNLNFLGGQARYQEISELTVIDVSSNAKTTLTALDSAKNSQ